MRTIPLLSTLFPLIATASMPQTERIQDAIAAINSQAASSGYAVSLTQECFNQWYRSERLFAFQKPERASLDSAYVQGILPVGYGFNLVQYAPFPARITFNSETIVEGSQCETWAAYFLPILQATPPALDENELTGYPAPDWASGTFPPSVPVKIQQIALTHTRDGKSVHVPALDIQFQITPSNIADLANYFETGYSAQEVATQLYATLGQAQSLWIPIQRIFRGWPAQWTNRFPADNLDGQGHSGNDVCFGVSRQFFRDTLANGGEDRSTEATELLLQNDYHPLPAGAQPTFGDYLYLPRQHAIRFIMKDPQSGRWIGITAWSDSETPYRLWWVDQDYQNPLSAPFVKPDPSFPGKMDLWRRNPPVDHY